MRWKQFLTPVKSLNVDQAREYMQKKPPDELTLLDVRQPNEYEAGHIPGARLTSARYIITTWRNRFK